jgi:protein-S-isoprenylcysteine O-methyltransferase Ste14
MRTFTENIRRVEFEARIFVSFAIVLFVGVISFSIFADRPAIGFSFLSKTLGLADSTATINSYLLASFVMLIASILRIWAGSILSSSRMMAFQVQNDALITGGPYRLVRNPIYLSDLIAACGFALCLPLVGLLFPVLLFLHYMQLVKYEETSLSGHFPNEFSHYSRNIPRLLVSFRSLQNFAPAVREFRITLDGLRHNALYLFFIPGFVVSAFTDELLYAVAIGLPAVLDWAFVHTVIGLSKKIHTLSS